MVPDNGFQRGIGTCMSPGAGLGHIQQRRCAECVHIVIISCYPETAEIVGTSGTITFAAADLWHAKHMKLFVGEGVAAVACYATGSLNPGG